MKSHLTPLHPSTLLRVFAISLFIPFVLAGCDLLSSDDDADGPNELGGDPNLEMTQVGQRFDAFVDLYDWIPDGYNWQDSIIVTKNDNGIVTMDVNISFDAGVLNHLDTVFGTQNLPLEAKLAVIDGLLEKYGATIDTTTPGTIKLHAEPKFKITKDGIQEFVSGGGNVNKPFTIIKYNANVGDTWTFKRDDGTTVRRTVIHHSTTEDYEVGFWSLKVFKTESVPENDPLFDKIIFVTNHKFGTVGAHLFTKDGKEIRFGVWPPTL